MPCMYASVHKCRNPFRGMGKACHRPFYVWDLGMFQGHEEPQVLRHQHKQSASSDLDGTPTWAMAGRPCCCCCSMLVGTTTWASPLCDTCPPSVPFLLATSSLHSSGLLLFFAFFLPVIQDLMRPCLVCLYVCACVALEAPRQHLTGQTRAGMSQDISMPSRRTPLCIHTPPTA